MDGTIDECTNELYHYMHVMTCTDQCFCSTAITAMMITHIMYGQ